MASAATRCQGHQLLRLERHIEGIAWRLAGVCSQAGKADSEAITRATKAVAAVSKVEEGLCRCG